MQVLGIKMSKLKFMFKSKSFFPFLLFSFIIASVVFSLSLSRFSQGRVTFRQRAAGGQTVFTQLIPLVALTEESFKNYSFAAEKLYSLSLSGKVKLKNETSFLRVVLIDQNKDEYLVYEAYPLIVDGQEFNINDVCEETCVLSGMSPSLIRIEGDESSLESARISFISEPIEVDIASEQKRLKKETDNLKIKKINEKRETWVAGETSVSKLTYAEKKKLFPGQLPNLQGFEYYKGGIFTLKTGEISVPSVPSPDLPASWDWRQAHGENWLSPVKDQRSCGSCWAFSSAGAIEANINLFYNQHLDFDLSEQDLVSCSNAGSCSGGNPVKAIDYAKDYGIVQESCFPYQATNLNCQNKCSDYRQKLFKISSNYKFYSPTVDQLKRLIIENGAINTNVSQWSHAMALIGYQGNADWKLTGFCDFDSFCSAQAACIPIRCQNLGETLNLCRNEYDFYRNLTQDFRGRQDFYQCVQEVDWFGQLINNWKYLDSQKQFCPSSDVCFQNKCRNKDTFKLSPGFKECGSSNQQYPNEIWQYAPGHGETYWIFKNSWGAGWGENGYARVSLPVINLGYSIPRGPFELPLDKSLWPDGFTGLIKCVDNDHDTYCNWGISPNKPSTCPSFCQAQKDADDSDPSIRALNFSFNKIISPSLPPLPPGGVWR